MFGVMMAELDASFPISSDTKLKKRIAQSEHEMKQINAVPKNCSKCHQALPVTTCIDCGGISLCSNCDKVMHTTSGKSKKQHRISDLSSPHTNAGEENGIAEGKLIDFDAQDEDSFASLVEAKPSSFLLVDGSEKLQVGHNL